MNSEFRVYLGSSGYYTTFIKQNKHGNFGQLKIIFKKFHMSNAITNIRDNDKTRGSMNIW